jgi:hypothetical protein
MDFITSGRLESKRGNTAGFDSGKFPDDPPNPASPQGTPFVTARLPARLRRAYFASSAAGTSVVNCVMIASLTRVSPVRASWLAGWMSCADKYCVRLAA